LIHFYKRSEVISFVTNMANILGAYPVQEQQKNRPYYFFYDGYWSSEDREVSSLG